MTDLADQSASSPRDCKGSWRDNQTIFPLVASFVARASTRLPSHPCTAPCCCPGLTANESGAAVSFTPHGPEVARQAVAQPISQGSSPRGRPGSRNKGCRRVAKALQRAQREPGGHRDKRDEVLIGSVPPRGRARVPRCCRYPVRVGRRARRLGRGNSARPRGLGSSSDEASRKGNSDHLGGVVERGVRRCAAGCALCCPLPPREHISDDRARSRPGVIAFAICFLEVRGQLAIVTRCIQHKSNMNHQRC